MVWGGRSTGRRGELALEGRQAGRTPAVHSMDGPAPGRPPRSARGGPPPHLMASRDRRQRAGSASMCPNSWSMRSLAPPSGSHDSKSAARKARALAPPSRRSAARLSAASRKLLGRGLSVHTRRRTACTRGTGRVLGQAQAGRQAGGRAGGTGTGLQAGRQAGGVVGTAGAHECHEHACCQNRRELTCTSSAGGHSPLMLPAQRG